MFRLHFLPRRKLKTFLVYYHMAKQAPRNHPNQQQQTRKRKPLKGTLPSGPSQPVQEDYSGVTIF